MAVIEIITCGRMWQLITYLNEVLPMIQKQDTHLKRVYMLISPFWTYETAYSNPPIINRFPGISSFGY